MVIHLTVGLLKNILSYKMSHFSEPYTCNKNKIKVEFHLSNYQQNMTEKNATGVNKSKIPKKANFGSVKSEIDKLDIDQLEKIPNGLTSLKIK